VHRTPDIYRGIKMSCCSSSCIPQDTRCYPHVPTLECTEKYLSATLESGRCRPFDAHKRFIITEYFGTDQQNDAFFTRVLEAAIVMRVDPQYMFTYSGNPDINIYNVQLGAQLLTVDLTAGTVVYDSTPVILTLGVGTFNHNSDSYTIEVFPTYFTLTSVTSGLIFSSDTNTIADV